MHHLHGPPQLDGEHINKARGPVSCSTDMAIVNHMKGTSIHLRHSSLSQSRQKFNSHICQLLWHSCEITPTCAHEAVQQLKNTSACIKNKTECKGKGRSEQTVIVTNPMCTYVPVFDGLWMIIDTCKQWGRHTRIAQTAVYHTTSLETRTGSAFSSSLAPCNISALATLPKQLWKTAFTHRRYFFDWLNFVFQCLRVCVDVLASR